MEIGVLFEKNKSHNINGKVILGSKVIDGVTHYGLFEKQDIVIDSTENLTEEQKNYILDNFVNKGWYLKSDGTKTFEWYLPNDTKTGKNRTKYLIVTISKDFSIALFADYNNTGNYIIDCPGDQESADYCYDLMEELNGQEVLITIGLCQYTDLVQFSGE